MATLTDPHFVVDGVVEDFGGSPCVLTRRLDDHYLLIRYGALLNGVPIATADLVAPLSGVEVGRDDVWAFFLNNVDDLKRFTVGQTVTLQHSIPLLDK